MRRLSLCCLFGWLLLVHIAPLGATAEAVNITSAIEYIAEPHPYQVSEVVSGKEKPAWQKITADNLRFGFSKEVYWLKIPGAIARTGSGEKFLIFEWKPLGRLDFYAIKENQIVDTQKAGESLPYASWSVAGTYYPTFAVAEDMQADYFLVRLASSSFKSFPVKLATRTGMLDSIRFETGFIWFYSGIVAVLLVFAGILFMANREGIYFFYAGYILSIAVSFNFTFGNAFSTLWPGSPWWQSRGVMFFLGLQIFFSAEFARRILNLKKQMPRMNSVIRVISWIALLTSPLTLSDQPRALFSRLYSSLYLLLIPAFYFIGIYLRNSAGHIRAFLIAWSILFFFGMLQIFYYFGVLPFSYIVVYGAVFAFPVDFFVFAYSIWRRYDDLRSDKEKLLAEKSEILDRLQKLGDSPRYAKSHLKGVDIEHILVRLDTLFQTEKLYKAENLRLEEVAARLGITGHQLSEILNTKFRKTFPAFVNLYRVDEAKKLLIEQPQINVLEVAFSTGFGSKTRFNVEFKRITGVNPLEFRNSWKAESDSLAP